jgi:nicotinamide phosphoribosyltransferase
VWDQNFKPAYDVFIEFRPNIVVSDINNDNRAYLKCLEDFKPKVISLHTLPMSADVISYNKFTQGAHNETPQEAGVIELLWDIFGGTVNAQGYKVLDPHIGAIYGDSITTERQVQIYQRLAAKGFAATNIVLGVGSFTYQYNTRDTLGFAAKGAWFEVEKPKEYTEDGLDFGGGKKAYNIYKDPITDDGSKKSLKGLCAVHSSYHEGYYVQTECTPEEEEAGLLQLIYEDGKFFNQVTLEEVRNRLK